MRADIVPAPIGESIQRHFSIMPAAGRDRDRAGRLEQELRRAFDGLDEAGKQFMNGYWQALLDQGGR